ncbi:hypothetical protein RvY_10187 [Ramazzottius varieornatus]|uniref:Exonuclease domain-containing protein n=1 Tax=Ramazzottius varieornatus TaxID=947166 RepID=A0A1D1VED2_RAMVA|nr:hypothetical protein RvY_10187 [Ramazzottius varieornatus]
MDGASRKENPKRKLDRLQNKVSKLKAFYELTKPKPVEPVRGGGDDERKQESSPDSGVEVEPKSHPKILPEDELEHLRARLRAQQKEKLSRPVLFQTTIPSMLRPADVRQLLMYALEGGGASGIKPEWCSLIRWQKISQVIVVSVENMTRVDWDKYSLANRQLRTFLEVYGPLEPQDEKHLSKCLLEYPLSITRLEKMGRGTKERQISQGSLFPMYKAYTQISLPPPQDDIGADCRFDLMMSIERMAMERFPIPTHQNGLDISYYVPTKGAYAPVTSTSPLFGVDCEMCMTSSRRHELTRISIVNETLQVVYDTYVKPFNPVLNYLTKYSGITKAILDPVKTRLHDVQEAIRKLLPPDAILCGQSLNGDLHALEMIHPYVIDTSVIYNLTGSPRAKTALKTLSMVFLGKKIQGADKRGHDSVEDSRTTMELVLLKLRHGPQFGDVSRGWEMPRSTPDKAAENSTDLIKNEPVNDKPVKPDAADELSFKNSLPPSQPKPFIDSKLKAESLEEFSGKPGEKRKAEESLPGKKRKAPETLAADFVQFTPDTPTTNCHFRESMLKCAERAKKTTYVVGSSDYIQEVSTKDPKRVHHVDSTRTAVKNAVENLPSHDFSFVELSLRISEDEHRQQKRTKSLIKQVLKLFSTAADRSLCMLVLSGNLASESSGICCAAVKNSIKFEALMSSDTTSGPAEDPE